MRKHKVPLARTNNLVVEELPNETLVYDRDSDKAHCLNSTVASVWKRCDGNNSVTEIADRLEEDMRAPVDEGVVYLALDLLSRRQLLSEPVRMPEMLAGMNRRQLIRALSVGALVALPVITSLVAPTAADAQSCSLGKLNDPCVFPSDCCPPLNCNFNGQGFFCSASPPS